MKLLLNDKEIAQFLMRLIDFKHKSRQNINYEGSFPATIKFVKEWRREIRNYKRKNPGKPFWLGKEFRNLKKIIARELEAMRNEFVTQLRTNQDKYWPLLLKHTDKFVEAIGLQNILDLYNKHPENNFVKSTGRTIDTDYQLIRRKDYTDYAEDCLIRNTTGNEYLLIEKIDNNYPFWFIDSGYTNFLETNKKWHRLVRNHLHYGGMFDAPVDRLINFRSFPKPWREAGEKILIVEPGPFAAGIFHVDLKTWKYDVERKLKKYTDKKIVFREKVTKKERTNLYEELLNEDYYCLVNINSNAATEAIWAGVPVITLDKHITNAVSTNKLSDINNLKRTNIANWLCMLSYSQFTVDELYDGTAFRCVNKYQSQK